MRDVRRIAFFVFPRLTLLDLVGVYDALRRVSPMGIAPGVTHRLIGTARGLQDETGFGFAADGVYEDLSAFDLLVVPGGPGTRPLLADARCIEYLRSWGDERPLASVCTGSLLLGRAGHLAGLRATTHHRSFELLRPFCREVVTGERVVDEGRVVTAGGVTSALDLGLHLVGKFWGGDACARIAAQMEYPRVVP
jgi:transcriptional regulator GlxA family with amidase domain